MKKTLFKAVTIASIILIMASCSSYSHSYRKADVPDRDLKVADKYVVDINHDFSKVVKAESGRHSTVKDAIDEAYYKAIVDNNIHVLIDPIYRVETDAKILFIFGGKSRAYVVGFAGFYTNPR